MGNCPRKQDQSSLIAILCSLLATVATRNPHTTSPAPRSPWEPENNNNSPLK